MANSATDLLVNNLTSELASDLTLGTTTFGDVLRISSATGKASFAGDVLLSPAQSDASSSGTQVRLSLVSRHQQSGTAGSTNLKISRSDVSLGSGSHKFLSLLAGSGGSTEKAYVDNTGKIWTAGNILAVGTITAKNGPLAVTGSRASGAALVSLLTQLAAIGLITDSTSA